MLESQSHDTQQSNVKHSGERAEEEEEKVSK